ncbi:hypothetical protein BD289DRAFT_47724 [Coniella lustricola]|uniref:Uncharacterized protein n=1 Tax=Coniella lustricola TaxID=2025994 RepID=A0A2T3AIF9_9PEZI|nr:hypothetical protein BD289DRAFT_47724 [Coniella lustricola]
MPTATTIASYTLTNLGPVTTVFTPAPSCSSIHYNGVEIGEYVSVENYLYSDSAALPANSTSSLFRFIGNDCAFTSITIGDCLPSGSVLDSVWMSLQTSSREEQEILTPTLAYYSPALDCPKDWSTVGLATKLANGSVTSTGPAFGIVDAETIYQASSTTTQVRLSDLENPPPNAILNAMGPGETAVLCCPSGYDANSYAIDGYCLSSLSSYSIPTTLCAEWYVPNETYVSTTLVADASTYTGSVGQLESPVSVEATSVYNLSLFRPTEAASTTLPPVVAVTEVAVLYMIHQASDGTSSSSSAKSDGVRSWGGGGGVLAVAMTVAWAFVSGFVFML